MASMTKALIFVAVGWMPLASVAQDSPAGPLFHEAVKEFTCMKTTLYQH